MGGVCALASDCAGEKTVSSKDEVHVGSQAVLQARSMDPDSANFFAKFNEVANAIAEAAQEAIAEVSGTPHPSRSVHETFGKLDDDDVKEGEEEGNGHHRLIVDFVGPKGQVKQVEFLVKKVGFSMAIRGGGCCGPISGTKVVVKELSTGSPAAEAGCGKGWEVQFINGVEVEGLKHAEKLIKDFVTNLPDAL